MGGIIAIRPNRLEVGRGDESQSATLRVGIAIAEGLASEGFEVEALRFRHRRKWQPARADLIGIGCPVFENRPAEVVTEFLDQSDLDLTGKQALVFITSGGSPARSLWHLSEAVRRRGGRMVGGVQIRGASAFPTLAGLFPERPNDIDLAHARSFGRAAAAAVRSGRPIEPAYAIDPQRGGRFYDTIGPVMARAKKKLIPVPRVDAEACDLCGRCVKECPSKSIKMRHRQVQVAESCIRCYCCWHVCPPMAVQMKMSLGNGLLERLLYSERMERRFGNIGPGESQGENRYRDVIARRSRLRYSEEAPTCEFE